MTLFMADCWSGMSRTQMIARAKRRGLRLSLRATTPCPSGVTAVFELRFHDGALECLLLARLQRVGKRGGRARRTSRTDGSRPPGARSAPDQSVLTRRYRLPRDMPPAMLAAFNGSGVVKCGV